MFAARGGVVFAIFWSYHQRSCGVLIPIVHSMCYSWAGTECTEVSVLPILLRKFSSGLCGGTRGVLNTFILDTARPTLTVLVQPPLHNPQVLWS
jgi:hypothetical protein